MTFYQQDIASFDFVREFFTANMRRITLL